VGMHGSLVNAPHTKNTLRTVERADARTRPRRRRGSRRRSRGEQRRFTDWRSRLDRQDGCWKDRTPVPAPIPSRIAWRSGISFRCLTAPLTLSGAVQGDRCAWARRSQARPVPLPQHKAGAVVRSPSAAAPVCRGRSSTRTSRPNPGVGSRGEIELASSQPGG